MYKKHSFTIMIGEVWHEGQKVIHYHVWVVCQNLQDPGDSMIIDVTADQSHVLPETVISSARELAQNGIQYITYTPVHNPRLLDATAQKRAALLEKNYQRIASVISFGQKP